MQEVARRLGRAASTISRELRRNAATRSGNLDDRATTAPWHAERAARRPTQATLAQNGTLRAYGEERLAGVIVAPNGAPVPGPTVCWQGRRHGPRPERRWAHAWSPEQIARRLPIDVPEEETMRISHEAISQALFVQARGALRRELAACLRTGRILARHGRHLARDHDRSPSGGGHRSCHAGPLGRRPHAGSWSLRDRHFGGAHHALHPPAAFAAHDGPCAMRLA